MIGSNNIAVIIETPPLFHPEHAEEAVKAGKHVYCAKPIAVDVPGCLSFRSAYSSRAPCGMFQFGYGWRNSSRQIGCDAGNPERLHPFAA